MRTSFKQAFIVLAFILINASAALATELSNLTPNEAMDVVKSIDELIILDIRTPDEVHAGHLKEAKNIDFYGTDFKARLDALDKETPYLIYCRTGRRSGVTIEYLQVAGFKRIYHLKDGITAWKAAGLPITR